MADDEFGRKGVNVYINDTNNLVEWLYKWQMMNLEEPEIVDVHTRVGQQADLVPSV